MLFPPDKLDVAFRQIKKTSQNGVFTLILASLDPDSICASKLISEALQSENVLYSLKPVRGMADVERILRSEEGCYRNIILINCGGNVDLTKRFENTLEDAYMYVIDSHRPFSHKNLQKNANRVIVFGGEVNSLDETFPTESDEEDNDNSDSDDDDSDNDQNEQKNEEKEEEAEFDEEEKNSKEAEDEPMKKRKKISLETKNFRKERVRKYYQQTYFGEPSSHVMYTLIQQLGKETSLASWAAIVGITSRYVMNDMSDEEYYRFVEYYRLLVLDRNPSIQFTRASVDDGSTVIRTPPKDLIEYQPQELRLVLYRHWSLFEACYNTEAFALRFSAWNSETSQDLELFFAEVGLSLRNAKQNFKFMSRESKMVVKNHKISEVAERHNYMRMTFPSFTLRSEFKTEISAEDAARCITSMLDDFDTGLSVGDDVSPVHTSNEIISSQNQQQQHHHQRTYEYAFTQAMDILGKCDAKLLTKAVETCKTHCRLLTAETMAVIQNNFVQPAGKFRWVKIELLEEEDGGHELMNGGGGHITERASYLSSPSAVVQLAKHIINAYQGKTKWIGGSGSNHLVLAAGFRGGKALVCGVPCPSQVGEVLKNPFGKLFTKSAKDINLEIDGQEFCESYVVKMDEEDVNRFLRAVLANM